MENTTSMQYWEQRIAEWRTSGLDIRDWCQKKQIDLKQFYIWKNKLKNIESQEPVFVEVTSQCKSKQYTNYHSTSHDNRLVLYCQGIKIYIPDLFNPDTLLSFLRTLKQL